MVSIALLVVIRLHIYLAEDGNDGYGFSGWMLAPAHSLVDLNFCSFLFSAYSSIVIPQLRSLRTGANLKYL